MKTGLRFIVVAILALITAQSRAMLPSAEAQRLRGVVRDAVTHEPIPYVAVFVTGTNGGALSDEHGRFNLRAPSQADSLRFSVMGYETLTIAVPKSHRNRIVAEMVHNGVSLKEVVVKPKKEKYSKKNNPAVDFLERIRSRSHITDPRRNDYYNYDKYEIMSVALNDYHHGNNWLQRKFKFVNDHIDTSVVSGKPILNISVGEKASTVHYRRDPHSEKEHVTGVKRAGIDQFADQESMRVLFEDVFREIDIYSNDIALLQNRFVSPLSRIGADFYKYYLTDTTVVDGDSCIVLSFVPHTPQTFGFIGKLYVPKNDSTMFIKKLEMHLPHSINVNYVDALTLTQNFVKAPDGSRLKTDDDMVIEFSLLPGTQSFYTRRNTVYDNFNFNRPDSIEERVFGHGEAQVVDNEASDRDEQFWQQKRLIPLEHNASSMSTMMEQMRSVPLFYWTERVVRLLVTNYLPTGDPSKFDYGPVNTSLSYGSVAGWRLRVGGMTTANLSKRWFARGNFAYGTRNKQLSYNWEFDYSFIDKRYHAREFPVKALRFTTSYGVDHLGEKYFATNADNIFLSLKRLSDKRVTYQRLNKLEYILELRNGFSLTAGIAYDRQEATEWIPFVNGYGQHFGHYNETEFSLRLRYAPGEKFYQGTTLRRPISFDAPVFEIVHTYAPKGFLGSMFTINRTELRIAKRFWLSAFGYIDAVVKGGHVWQSSPYINVFIPPTNLSYTIQPESFTLMNPLEFINDTYGMVDVTYWLNGLIFNRIPLFNKLRMREVVNFKGILGHLSDRNDPKLHPELLQFPTDVTINRMSKRPYMEMSVGLDNILTFLRVDYVWRLSYRNTPGAPNSGFRIAMHFAF